MSRYTNHTIREDFDIDVKVNNKKAVCRIYIIDGEIDWVKVSIGDRVQIIPYDLIVAANMAVKKLKSDK